MKRWRPKWKQNESEKENRVSQALIVSLLCIAHMKWARGLFHISPCYRHGSQRPGLWNDQRTQSLHLQRLSLKAHISSQRSSVAQMHAGAFYQQTHNRSRRENNTCFTNACLSSVRKITQDHMGSSSHAAFDNQRIYGLWCKSWWLTVAKGCALLAWGCFKLVLFFFVVLVNGW